MWEALPPLTKVWLGLSVSSTALASFGTIDPGQMAFFLPMVVEKLELWRFLTCFIFFGKFSFGFLMQMFILSRFSAAMETDPYRTSHVGGTTDFAFALLLMASMCLVAAWAMDMFFMGPTLVFAVLYLWSKRNPEAPTSIWGFRFKGAQLPWALIAFNVLIGGSPVGDLIGVFVGHVYYFLVEVYPLSNGGAQVIKTPAFLIRLVDSATGQTPQAPGGVAPEVAARRWQGQGQALGGG